MGGRGPGFEVRLSASGPLQLLTCAPPKALPASWGRRVPPSPGGRDTRQQRCFRNRQRAGAGGPGPRTGVRVPGAGVSPENTSSRQEVGGAGGAGDREGWSLCGGSPRPQSSLPCPGPWGPSRLPPHHPRKPLPSVCSFYSSGVRKTNNRFSTWDALQLQIVTWVVFALHPRKRAASERCLIL